jgi:DNA (cytosine-5)-methyltransferase 1
MVLTVGSLFSGIGGIDLGLERAGMESRWFVEWDAHCQNVLRRHWPGLPVYGDITTVDWSTVEPVDVLAGGFPCQPVSNAGKRLGTDDARWLWPEFARAIRVLEPRYVLVENVAALLGRGFEHVITDLAALGYDAEWDCIPAAAVGAPHLRDRLWTVAYSSSSRGQNRTRLARSSTLVRSFSRAGGRSEHGHPASGSAELRRSSTEGEAAVADAAGERSGGQRHLPHAIFAGLEGYERSVMALTDYRRSNADPAGSGWWSTEPGVGRVADGIPHRVDRLRSLGNAVVPQVVEWIGRRIVAFDERAEVAA